MFSILPSVQILKASYKAGTHTIEFTNPVANLTVNIGTITEQHTYYCVLTLASDSDIIITGNKYDSQDIETTYFVRNSKRRNKKN